MRKKKILFIIISCILVLSIVLGVGIYFIKKNNKPPHSGDDEDNTQEENYTLQKVKNVDADNSSNISSWEEIPIVSQELLDRGIQGGEGAQWPLCIAGDNVDGKLIFYGTDVGGIFKSTDGGNTWYKSNKGLYSHGICDIQIDPNNRNRVVAFGVNGGRTSYTTGMYYSLDAGETWNFSKHFPINGHRNTIEDLAYDPTSYSSQLGGSSILYLSLIEKLDITTSVLTDDNKGLYKSTDGGVTWSQINKDLGDSIVKVDNQGNVYCGNSNGLFVSKDKGETFINILQDNVTGLDVVDNKAYILVNQQPNSNNIPTYAKIYIYENNNLNLHTTLTGGTSSDPDAGNTHLISENWQWHYVKGGSDDKCLYHFSSDVHKVYNIKVSPINTNNMVIVMTNSLYWESASHTVLYSNDGGNTFNISTPNKLKVDENKDYNMLPYSNRRMNFYWSYADENTVFDFENDWLSVSRDAGKSFYWNSNGINGIMCGGKFNFNLYNNNIMYFGSQDYCGALTVDGGKTWKYLNLSKDNPLNDSANIYGGYGASENVLFGVFAPRNSSERYVTVSFDAGETNNIVIDDNHKITKGYIRPDGVSRMMEQASYSSYQSMKDKNILFCANLKSSDMGQNWSPMSGVTGVYAHDNITGQLYGINDTLGQVVTSADDGETWNVVAESTDICPWWNNAYISDLAFDSVNKIIYVTCQWKALFKIYVNDNNRVEEITHNIPTSYTDKDSYIGEGLGTDTYFQHRLTTVAVDPNNTNIVYAGGANYKYRADASTFRSCDGGKTFYVINANNTNSIVTGIQGGAEPLCLRVNPSTGDLWVAGNCLGFSKLSAPYETSLSGLNNYHKVKIIDSINNENYYLYVYNNRRITVDDIVKTGFVFDGLYIDKSCTTRYNQLVTSDIVLYLKLKSA